MARHRGWRPNHIFWSTLPGYCQCCSPLLCRRERRIAVQWCSWRASYLYDMKSTCPFAAQLRPGSSAGEGTKPSACPFGGSASSSSSPSSAAAAVTCPLGFGVGTRLTAASFASSGLPRMPLAVLAGHPTLVSVKGVVFDVSDDEAYQEAAGGALAGCAGHDASRLLALSTGGFVGGLNEGLEGLRYEDHQRLEVYFLKVARARRAVAVLIDEDYMCIFGTPVVISGDANYSPATATLAPDVNANMNTTGKRAASPAAELHASVEQGDGEAVARVLSQHQQHRRDEQELGGDDAEKGEARRRDWLLLVDCACPRTGMTPLLKAVERGSEGSVRALLQAGADVRSRVSVKVGAVRWRRCPGSRQEIGLRRRNRRDDTTCVIERRMTGGEGA
ncbi:unnamed protein product [Pylaiella littoralis]